MRPTADGLRRATSDSSGEAVVVRLRQAAAEAEHYRTSGNPRAADRCWRQLLAFLTRQPDAERVRAHRARVLGNRAILLRAMGRYQDAERLYARAQALFDSASADLLHEHERALVRLNRANNLASMGRHQPADALFAEAQALFEAARDQAASVSDRRLVYANRASNLHAMGRYLEADSFFARARELSDAEPPHPAARWTRSNLLMNSANNHHAMGRLEAAESLYEQAHAALEGFADDHVIRTSRAILHVNRAGNIAAMGRHQDAESFYGTAQQLFDSLHDDAASRAHRVSVRMNRAINLQTLGRRTDAESLFVESQRLCEALPAHHASRALRARLCLNRAINLTAMQRPRDAAPLYAKADRMLKRLPDGEAVRIDRATLHLNLVWHLLDTGRAAMAAARLDEGFALFDDEARVRLDEGGRAARLMAQYASVVVAVWRADALERPVCESRLLLLWQWSLDWLDCMPEPTSDAAGTIPGAADAALTVGIVLSWLVEHGRVELVPGLLEEYHSRYASAQRLAGAVRQHAEGDGAEAARQIVSHRMQLRRLAWQIRALESGGASARDAMLAAQLQGLYERRRRLRNRFLTRQRQWRGRRSSERRVAMRRLQETLRRAPRPAALVVLLRVSRPSDEHREIAEPRALALVITPASSTPHAVSLPAQVLAGASESSWSLPSPSPAPATAPRRTRPAGDRRGASIGDEELPDGMTLRAAVAAGWMAIEPALGPAQHVHLALHHELGRLPWQAADDAAASPRTLTVHHGIGAALRVLDEGEDNRPVRPPGKARPIGVFAYSPDGRDPKLPPIPAVHADSLVTATLVAHHRLLRDRDDLLRARLPLLQLSCHGDARGALTGEHDQRLSAYDVAIALGRRRQRLDACILIACSTGGPGGSPWGEFDGWSVVLGESTRLVVGALYPIDDHFSSLYVLLLHRAWIGTRDLKAAVREVRQRLRSGRWADSETECRRLEAIWSSAIATIGGDHPLATGRRPRQTAAPPPLTLDLRRALYEENGALCLLAESFVVFG
jgi:tetratricopeptide (TPR) repeat protein